MDQCLSENRARVLQNRGIGTDDVDTDIWDSFLCVAGARLVSGGFDKNNFADKILKFINAGGGTIEDLKDSGISVGLDTSFEGGDTLRTEEEIIDGGDLATLYQSARFGNFCYQFKNLQPGDYFIDLHFVEIVNTNGPKGIRVFNVFIQEEKVVSELDIYAIVGANKPLQLVDFRVPVRSDGVITIRFEGVDGGSIVSGICIKEAPKILVSPVKQGEGEKFAAGMETVSIENKNIRMCSITKYEKKIKELSTLCELKTNECYQAWMSLTAANEELQTVKMELDNKSFQILGLDQAKNMEEAKLREFSSRYKHERQFWEAAIDELRRNIKTLKEEHSQLSHKAHECADSVPELNKMATAVQDMVSQCQEFKLKYNEELAKRKQLYNQIQEAKGNIRVFCRCRPLSKDEMSAGYATIVDFTAAKDGDLGILTGPSSKKTYRFDRVYTPSDGQADVFSDAQPMVISVLDGYNVCIFAYGQTGTGKTFTMEGSEHNRGVNYRTLEELFRLADERKEAFTYKISVSVLEIYNEQIRDLLATGTATKKLEIRQVPEGFHHVPGVVEAKIKSIEEVWNVLQAGTSARMVGSNNVNEHSSRSHCMLCVTVGAKNLINGECTQSKLWLVDLAGSERLAKTEVQGDRLKEAQNINRSLSALGDVISALVSKNSHIPYRNSKLTHLLQDSLGGNSKTLMFVQVSPCEKDSGETVCSLNFATRARGVELGAARKQLDTGELQKLKLQLDKAKQESRFKDESLRNVQENYQNLEEKFKEKERSWRSQQEKVKELEIQLQSKSESCKQMEKQLLQLTQGIKGKENFCTILQHKIDELENKIKDFEYQASNALQDKSVEFERQLRVNKCEFEHQIRVLEEKNTELENQVNAKKSEFQLQTRFLQEKIKELEEKLNWKDTVSENLPPYCSSEKSKNKPSERGRERDTQGLILKVANRSESHASLLLKKTDSLRELKRKHDLQNRGIENNLLPTTTMVDKKPISTETSKRHIEPSKAFARVTRTTKAFPGSQKVLSSRQVQGIKERDSSSKAWLR